MRSPRASRRWASTRVELVVDEGREQRRGAPGRPGRDRGDAGAPWSPGPHGGLGPLLALQPGLPRRRHAPPRHRPGRGELPRGRRLWGQDRAGRRRRARAAHPLCPDLEQRGALAARGGPHRGRMRRARRRGERGQQLSQQPRRDGCAFWKRWATRTWGATWTWATRCTCSRATRRTGAPPWRGASWPCTSRTSSRKTGAIVYCGQGDLPWGEVLPVLKECGYDGYLMVETPPDAGGIEAGLAAARQSFGGLKPFVP